jgi:Rrf2 family protein
MLSKKTKYAIKALTALSKVYPKKQYLRVSEIAESEQIPKKFLEAILVEFRDSGIVASKMGSKGGYVLLKAPKAIMLSTIIRSTGGPIALAPCVSINFYAPCDECEDEATCGLRLTLLQVRVASVKILANTSLAQLIKQETKLKEK